MKKLLITTILSMTAVSTSAATYIVKPGDTLMGIANRTGTTLSKIAGLNKIPDDKAIGYIVKTGQKLNVPDQKQPRSKPKMKSDTFPINVGDHIYMVQRNGNHMRVANNGYPVTERVREPIASEEQCTCGGFRIIETNEKY